MRGDAVRASVLSMKTIPRVDAGFGRSLGLKGKESSLGLFTLDSDDVGYTACDEATKKADVRVVYAKSFYGGASNASTKLAGEFIGILAGPDPESVKSGLESICLTVKRDACFYSANAEDSIVYFAHCISRSGSYLSAEAGIPPGDSLAYLIAPPLEAVYALDKALKATDTELALCYKPPTETNFAGGLLHGSQSACQEACIVFADEVCRVADNPIESLGV